MPPTMHPGLLPALLLGALLAASVAPPPAGSIALGLSGSGALSARAVVTDANGSALRYAMDGNFTPLVSLLVENASQRASILSQIAIAEATPIVGSFFGNHDGVVEPSEVTLFESLLEQQARLLPSTSLTGGAGVGLTLDGAPPTSVTLSGIAFANATGPVDSSAPIVLTTSLAYQFAYRSGAHVLALTLNNSSLPAAPGNASADFSVTFTTPSAMAITGSRGFASGSVANDPWGLGTSTFRGVYATGSSTGAAIDFAPAFPTAYAAAGVALAAGLVAFVLLWRRRRRAAR